MSLPADAARPSRPRYVLLTVVLLVLMAAMQVLEPLSKRADASEILAVALGPSIIVGVVLLIASLRARWESARPKIAFWTSAILFLGHCSRLAVNPVAQQNARTDALSSLRTDGQWIRHSDLGFELPHPGAGFAVDSTLQAVADSAAKGHALAWVFTHDSLPDGLTIMVADSVRRYERGFRRFVSGIRNAAGAQAVQVTRDTISWQDGRGEYRVGFTIGDERRDLRCIAFESESFQIRIVCATTASLGRDSLAFVREGLRPLAP